MLFSKKISRVSYFIVVAVAVILICGGYFFFQINKIVIDGADPMGEIKGLELVKNQNIFLFSESDFAKQIYLRNPQIKFIKVTKLYPMTLHIVIQKNKPVTELLVNQGYFLLASDGRIIAKTKDKSNQYPVLKYYQKLNYFSYEAGVKVDFKDILATLDFLATISELQMPVDSIDINGLHMIAFNMGESVVVFNMEKSIDIQKHQLTAIIKQSKISGRIFKRIDLRFEKPVVEF